jgi:hypothetical protein
VDIQLRIDASEVAFDGLLAEKEGCGDVAVGLAGGDFIGNLALAWTESRQPCTTIRPCAASCSFA